MNDLFTALQMFQNGAKEYAIGNAMRGAADQVKAINSAQQGEFEKRQQLDDLGKGLALQLGSYGAPVSQIQSAAGSIMPPALNAPQDFFAQAAQAKTPEASQELAKAGLQVQKSLQALSPAQIEQMKLGWAQLASSNQQAKVGANLKKSELDMQSALKTQEELDKTDETQYRYNSLLNNAQELKSKISQSGTFELFGTASADMDSFLYQMAVDYAKIVDPTSVAREGEVETAKKFMLPIRQWGGLGYSNETALKMVDNYTKSLDDRLRAQKSAKKGVMLGITKMPQKDVMIMEAQVRAKNAALKNPDDPRIPYLLKAVEGAKRNGQ